MFLCYIGCYLAPAPQAALVGVPVHSWDGLLGLGGELDPDVAELLDAVVGEDQCKGLARSKIGEWANMWASRYALDGNECKDKDYYITQYLLLL